MMRASAHVSDRLAALLDGALSPREGQDVLAHLASCPPCAEEHAAALRGRDALAALGAVRMPEDTADRLRRRLTQAPAAATRLRGAALLAGLAAALLIVATTGAVVGSGPRVDDRPSSEGPTRFEQAVLDLFTQAEAGDITLDRRSESPAELRRYVATATGLGVQLAPERPPEDAGRFRAVGARALEVDGVRAASVVYEVDGGPVVLLTARADDVRDGPAHWSPLGKDVRHRVVGGRQVLTWANSGQVYTLVSRLSARGSAACLLCHVDERRRAQIAKIG